MKRRKPQATHVTLSPEMWGVINGIKAETIDPLMIQIVKRYADRCMAAGVPEEVMVGSMVLSMLTNLVKAVATFKKIPHHVYLQNQGAFQDVARLLQEGMDHGINTVMKQSRHD